MATPVPTMQDILRDYRAIVRKGGGKKFHAMRAVSRWIRCGHDLNTLPLMLDGLTPEIIEAGRQHAAEISKACETTQ